MKVHIIVHYWSDYDRDGTETCGAFTSKKQAVREMRAQAREEKKNVKEMWNKKFHSDFALSDDDYISFGWYNEDGGPDSVWNWKIETEEVQ